MREEAKQAPSPAAAVPEGPTVLRSRRILAGLLGGLFAIAGPLGWSGLMGAGRVLPALAATLAAMGLVCVAKGSQVRAGQLVGAACIAAVVVGLVVGLPLGFGLAIGVIFGGGVTAFVASLLGVRAPVLASGVGLTKKPR